jgi:hypothetical protein
MEQNDIAGRRYFGKRLPGSDGIVWTAELPVADVDRP